MAASSRADLPVILELGVSRSCVLRTKLMPLRRRSLLLSEFRAADRTSEGCVIHAEAGVEALGERVLPAFLVHVWRWVYERHPWH